MSDTPPADDPSTPPADDTPPETPTDTPPADLTAEVEKWKAMARKHEGNAKANAEAARKLAEIEDAAKSEAERLAEQATKAEQRAAKAESELLKHKVASAKGIPPELIDRLKGTTEEELAEDADRLLALIKPTDGTTPKPAGSADTGPQGDPPNNVKQLTRADLQGMTSEEITAAKEAGQLNELLGIS